MLQRRLRFEDLKRLGYVNNRTTLKRWVDTLGFPAGEMTGPNTRTWGENEVAEWHASRPSARVQSAA